ncbi:MAG: TrmH family RNA methyltransferase [Kiritimatiellia bacterium]
MQSEYIYGVNPALEVLNAGRRRVVRAWLADESQKNPRLRKLRALLAGAKVPVEHARREQLARHCGSNEHQGVVLMVTPYVYAALDEVLAATRVLLLDNVEDPQNVGAILRSAEVFGWSSVLLSRRGVPPVYASVVKASAGAVEHLQVCRELTANACVRRAREAGFQIWAMDAAGQLDIGAASGQIPEKLLLVIGGEHCAVGQFILNEADRVLVIPQAGRVSSLNASVAAGIALFALR